MTASSDTLCPGHPATRDLGQHLPPPPPDHLAPVDLHLVDCLRPAERRVLLYLGVATCCPAAGGELDTAVSPLSPLTALSMSRRCSTAVSDQDWAVDLPHQDVTFLPGDWLTPGLALLHILLSTLRAQPQPHLHTVRAGGGRDVQGRDHHQHDQQPPGEGHHMAGTGSTGGSKADWREPSAEHDRNYTHQPASNK